MGRPQADLGTWGKISSRKNANGTWTARGRYRDADGRKHDWTASAATKARAESALRAKAETSRSAGAYSASMTVSELWGMVESGMRAAFNENPETAVPTLSSISEYSRVFRRDVAPRVGHLRLFEVRTTTVDEMLDEMRSRVGATATQARNVLKVAFDEALRTRVVEYNPVDYLKPEHKGKIYAKGTSRKPTRSLTAAEVVRVFEVCRQRKNNPGHAGRRAIPLLEVFTLLFMGPRIGEVLALRWEDFTWGTAERPTRVHVCGKVTRTGGRSGSLIRVNSRKGGRKGYWLDLPDAAADVLLAYREETGRDSGLVFVSAKGGLISPENLRRSWREIREVSGLPEGVTPHDGRRTAGTIVSKEFGTEVASRVLGHESSRTTERHYEDVEALTPDATTALGRLFFAE